MVDALSIDDITILTLVHFPKRDFQAGNAAVPI